MLKNLVGVMAGGVFFLASQGASASVLLDDWGINVDGALTLAGDPLPLGVDGSGFDFTAGLGQINLSITGSGTHFVSLFVDHEIAETTTSFFNESGASHGAALAGSSWEIDEPGFVFGDIYDNWSFSDNATGSLLDNTDSVAAGSEDDVSMALAWDFTLAAGETASVNFFLSDLLTPTGFYLQQHDLTSGEDLYFSTSLSTSSAVPEPSVALLMSWGLLGLVGVTTVVKRRS